MLLQDATHAFYRCFRVTAYVSCLKAHSCELTAPLCLLDIVPVYHLGQTQLLTFLGAEELSRKVRAL